VRALQMANNPACAVCYLPSPFICSGCRDEWYCCEACQRQHWRDHKQDCERGAADAAVCLRVKPYSPAILLDLLKNLQLGLPHAISSLGRMYMHGCGDSQRSDAVARRLFEMGAASGPGSSMVWLGQMHREGRGGLEPSTEAALNSLRGQLQLARPGGSWKLATRVRPWVACKMR
jgi:TPR repeat protein